MDSWWQLGEGYGQLGKEFAVYQITCPFCMEQGTPPDRYYDAATSPSVSLIVSKKKYLTGKVKFNFLDL